MNKKMKGKSEQRQQWWKSKKREQCWKKTNWKNKGTEQKQRMKVFCRFLLCFDVKREKDLNSFKNNGKYDGCFRTRIVFSKKKREQKHNSKDSFSIISIKKTTFFTLGYIKKKDVKKKETDFTRRIKKKGESNKVRNHFSRDRKTKHGKN